MSVVADVDQRGFGFSLDDLRNIAKAFHGLGLSGRVPLKFGHNGEQPMTDGQPALGWLSNVYVEGDRLKGDFTDVPKVVYDAIHVGSYKHVSVELLRDVQAGTRVIPWVLDAVALLGADQPAFGNLKDLQSLTMSTRRAALRALQAVERVSFQREKFKFSTNREGNPMSVTKEEMEVALKKQGEQFTAELKKRDEVHAEELKKRDEMERKAKLAARRKAVTELFNGPIERQELKPAHFEQFKKLTKFASDEAVLAADDLEEVAQEFITSNKVEVKKSPAGGGDGGKPDDAVSFERYAGKKMTASEMFAAENARVRKVRKLPATLEHVLAINEEILREAPAHLVRANKMANPDPIEPHEAA